MSTEVPKYPLIVYPSGGYDHAAARVTLHIGRLMTGTSAIGFCMRDRILVALVLSSVVVFYFFAPVVFWFNFYRATRPARTGLVFAVYRPLSCETLGVGVTYTTNGHLYLTCDPHITTGATAERVVAP